MSYWVSYLRDKNDASEDTDKTDPVPIVYMDTLYEEDEAAAPSANLTPAHSTSLSQQAAEHRVRLVRQERCRRN